MIDQINQLLHQELSKKARQISGKSTAESTAIAQTTRQGQAATDSNAALLRARLDQLIKSGVVEPPVLVRAGVEYMLQREFGNELANLSSFQEMMDWVTNIILEDPVSEAILADLLKM